MATVTIVLKDDDESKSVQIDWNTEPAIEQDDMGTPAQIMAVMMIEYLEQLENKTEGESNGDNA